MASQHEVEAAAASLRDELYRTADSGLYPEEQQTLFDLNLSVAAALRQYMERPGGDEGANGRAVAACAAARRALDQLRPGDAAGLQEAVRRTSQAVSALEAATG
jgi:hypothetical protein